MSHNNEHDVAIATISYSPHIEVPVLCQACCNLYIERGDWEQGHVIKVVQCKHNHWLPTRKGTCKRFARNDKLNIVA